MRSQKGLWIALPGDVNHAGGDSEIIVQIVQKNGEWKIEGAGSEKARIAYATIRDNSLSYRIAEAS